MDTLIGSVPDSWWYVKLTEVCDDILAGPSGTRVPIGARTPGGIPVIMPQSLRNNRIIEDGGTFVSSKHAASLWRYTIRAADVVVVRTGALGRQGLATEEQDGWLLGTGCLRVRGGPALDPRYLVYYLGHPAVRDWIIRNGAGSAIPTLTVKTLGSLPITVPPPSAQAAIGETLSAFDEKITVHEQIAATTAALRDAIAPLLFTGNPG